MYTLINGSPKPINSNSGYFLKIINSTIEDSNIYNLRKDKYENILENINKSDVIILAFPLYADSPSSITLSFLDYIIDNKINIKNKLIYVVINCGFKEGEQNITALNIIKRWCSKVEGIFMGSILIGAGEITGKEKNKIISKKVIKNIKKFSNNIKLKEKSGDIITTMDFLNNKLYCYIANIFWNKKGKKNNLNKEQLKIK